jgi:CBS domain-containing protein
MNPNPISVTPETTTLDAIRIMREAKVSCLPVVEKSRLVGIVTEHDLMAIAAPLLERFLSD